MKTKFNKIHTILFGVFMLFGAMSCQNEALNSDENSSSESTELANRSQVSAMDWSCNAEAAQTVDLFAGQNILVGNVTVEVVGENYLITYNITNEGYCLTETHLSVVMEPTYFPVNRSGNPVIGAFEYSQTHDCITSYTYPPIPTSRGTYIAAHAVVNCKDGLTSEEFLANLPSTIEACVEAKPGVASYFDLDIAGDNSLSGIIGAWCLDDDTILNFPDCFEADVYTVFDDLSGLPIDFDENLRAINWILNQDYINNGYTYGDIQWAIWKFIEGQEINSPFLGVFTKAKGLEIYNAALMHLDYVPQCGDLLGIILIPTNPAGLQPTIIVKPFECGEVGDCDETAFGAGCDFPGNNWFTYFQYGAGPS